MGTQPAEALTGEPGSDVPFRVRHKNGSEYWIDLSWNPVFDREDRFVGFRTSARDITERKAANDQLRFTQYTVDKAVQSIFWIDPGIEKIIYANDTACQSGLYPIGIVGMTVARIDRDFPEGSIAGLMGSLRGQQFMQTEGKHLTKDGKSLDVELFISLARHEEREVLIVFAKDITRQKQAERELIDSQQRLDMALEGGNLGTWDRDFITDQTIVDERWAKLLVWS